MVEVPFLYQYIVLIALIFGMANVISDFQKWLNAS